MPPDDSCARPPLAAASAAAATHSAKALHIRRSGETKLRHREHGQHAAELRVPGQRAIRTHGTETGRLAAKLIPKSELHIIWEKDLDADLGPAEDWEPKNAEMAGYFVDMMKRAEAMVKV